MARSAEAWLARRSSIEEMGPPHRFDLRAWAKSRAVCGGGLVVEVEAAVWLKLG